MGAVYSLMSKYLLDTKLNVLDTKLNECKAKLNEVYSSKSWRIAIFLRKLIQTLRLTN